MGTRSDYYVKRKSGTLEWIGSLEFNGWRVDKTWKGDKTDPLVLKIRKAKTAKDFRKTVKRLLDAEWNRLIEMNYNPTSAVFYPDGGWPWLWATSATTDYTYVFERGKLVVFDHGDSKD